MKFKQYIIENEEDLIKITKLIKRECNDYIKTIIKANNGNYVLVRNDYMDRNYFRKKVRKNRKPTDSKITWHNEMNSMLFKKFGWKARSEGLFCYNKIYSDVQYHDYIVFPVGKFEYIWSPKIKDAYNLFDANAIDPGKEWKDLFHTYKSNDIKEALKSKSEIMVKCDYAWLISTKTTYINILINTIGIPSNL